MSDRVVHLEDYKAGSGGSDDETLPIIRLEQGRITAAIEQLDSALQERPADLFQRGGFIVHPVLQAVPAADGRETQSWQIKPVTDAYLAMIASRAAKLERFDARRGAYVRVNCPALIAQTYRSCDQWNGLRLLTRVVTTPTLRPDGSILQRPGYDPTTGLLFDPGKVTFPPIAANPSKDDAKRAYEFLTAPFETFDFVAEHDRSVFVAGLLCSLSRAAISTAPLTGISSPVAGSGKTMLIDAAAILSTGRVAAVISQGHTEEEFEKRLSAVLLAGDGLICIDNCEFPIEGALLCQAITQTMVKIRILGASAVVDVPTVTALFATGVNLVARGDMSRRMLLCSLDPQVEQPERRKFTSDPLTMISADRANFVAAALTVLRARVVSGWVSEQPPLGSFAAWSYLIRDSFLWLGKDDPCEALEKMRDRDPRLVALTAVLDEWEHAIGEEPVLASKVIDQVSDRIGGEYHWPSFREALLAVAGEKGAFINSVRLGLWLSKNTNRIVRGRRFVKDGEQSGVARWKLELVER